jgi:ParB family chromosome partitioning protein
MATIKDRASSVNFGGPAIVHADGERKKKTETAPGMMADVMIAESIAINENKELKGKVASFEGSLPTRHIDPTLIKPSKWVNRSEQSFHDSLFANLKADIFSAGGNVQPIKVRPVFGSTPQTYEIVFGHRRHRACLDLGINVLAMIELIDDTTLFMEMDRENRQRADLRPYEQGVMYARALDERLFPSMRKMAEALGIEAGTASKAVSIAKFPVSILEAFQSPLDIQFRWAVALKAAIDRDQGVVLARAADIIAKRAAGATVSSQSAFNVLIGKDHKPATPTTKVVKVGSMVLSISEWNNKVSFELDKLAKDKLTKIEKFISEVMGE